jgi:hypothetical protein
MAGAAADARQQLGQLTHLGGQLVGLLFLAGSLCLFFTRRQRVCTA